MSAKDRHNRRRDRQFDQRRREKDTAAGRSRRTVFRARSRTTCPEHSVPLLSYGSGKDRRVRCPVPGCDIGASNVPTSAPASRETRRKRREAHESFDLLWFGKPGRRNEAYRALARELGISMGRCHIGMFDLETCERVIAWAKGMKGKKL